MNMNTKHELWIVTCTAQDGSYALEYLTDRGYFAGDVHSAALLTKEGAERLSADAAASVGDKYTVDARRVTLTVHPPASAEPPVLDRGGVVVCEFHTGGAWHPVTVYRGHDDHYRNADKSGPPIDVFRADLHDPKRFRNFQH